MSEIFSFPLPPACPDTSNYFVVSIGPNNEKAILTFSSRGWKFQYIPDGTYGMCGVFPTVDEVINAAIKCREKIFYGTDLLALLKHLEAGYDKI